MLKDNIYGTVTPLPVHKQTSNCILVALQKVSMHSNKLSSSLPSSWSSLTRLQVRHRHAIWLCACWRCDLSFDGLLHASDQAGVHYPLDLISRLLVDYPLMMLVHEGSSRLSDDDMVFMAFWTCLLLHQCVVRNNSYKYLCSPLLPRPKPTMNTC